MSKSGKMSIEDIRTDLMDISSSLNGLGGLFMQGAPDLCLTDEEFFGIGQILKRLANDVYELSEKLATQSPSQMGKKK